MADVYGNIYGMNDYYASGPHEADLRDPLAYDSLRDEPRDEDLQPEPQRASNVAWRARLAGTR